MSDQSPLEREVAELKAKLAELTQRVRIDAVAERFIAGDHSVREGDYFILDHGLPTRLSSVSPSSGKWTYFNGSNVIEPFRVPSPTEYDRLYTIREVAEIVAKITKGTT